MQFSEILKLQNEVFGQIQINPETAFDYFKAAWNPLSFEDKRLFAPQVILHCANKINNKPDYINAYYPSIPDNYDLQQICCSAIHHYISDEFNGRIDVGNLSLGPGITLVDIAAVFKILVDSKYINNSLSEIEEVIVKLFNLPDKKTIDSYLNDNSKLKAAAKRFKEAVNATSLVSR